MGPVLLPCDFVRVSATEGPGDCAAVSSIDENCLVSDSVPPFLCSFDCMPLNLSNSRRICFNHERPTQPNRYAATAAFSTITIRCNPFFIQITYGFQIQHVSKQIVFDSVLPVV